MEQAENAISEELNSIKNDLVPERELRKVKNKIESTMVYSDTRVLNRAINLSLAELREDASLVNSEIDKYKAVDPDQIKKISTNIFREENSSSLYYYANDN